MGVPRCFKGEGEGLQYGRLTRNQATREAFLTEVGSERFTYMEGVSTKQELEQTIASARASLRPRK